MAADVTLMMNSPLRDFLDRDFDFGRGGVVFGVSGVAAASSEDEEDTPSDQSLLRDPPWPSRCFGFTSLDIEFRPSREQ